MVLTLRLLGGDMRDVLAVQGDTAAVGALKARQDAQEGGLAAAAGAQQGKELALVDGQRDIGNGAYAPKTFRDVFKFQESALCHLCRMVTPRLRINSAPFIG